MNFLVVKFLMTNFDISKAKISTDYKGEAVKSY